MSQTAGHAMLQQPTVAQHVNVNYANTNVPNTTVGFQASHHGHGGHGGSDGIVGTSESPHGLHALPTMSGNSSTSSSWTKSPPLQVQQGSHPSQPGMMTSGDVHHHQHHLRSSNNSSYGAPFNNHFQSQQHCLYSQQQHNMELRYDSSNSGSSSVMRPNSASDYPSNVEMANANSYYHHEGDDRVSDDCRQQQYYGSSMDQHGFSSYDHHPSHHHQGNELKNSSGSVGGTSNGTSSCAMMSSGGNSGGHNSFYHHNYGYSNQNSQQYHHHHEMYSGGDTPSNSPDDFVTNSSRTLSTVGGGSAMNNANRYFDSNHHHSQRPDGSSYNMYNSSSCGYSNSNNNGSNCSTNGNGRYGMMSSSSSVPPHYNTSQIVHGHHHHPPFRRKSMESYISEPGEMRYNNKYGCISSSSSPSSFPAQQSQQYISPSPSPSSTTMVKRECLSNPSSSALPVMPNGSSPDCSPWNARATPTNNDIQMHDQHPQHHDNSSYLYPDQSGSTVTMAMTDLDYGSGPGGSIPYGNGPPSGNNGNDGFHHPTSHQHLSNFKSCAFGGQSDCSKMDGDLKDSNYGVKAGSVKHRSLSLSMPSSSSPSPYPGMGQMPSSSQGNFPNNESHMKSHVESHRSDNSPNSSSCCNPLEKVGSGESHIMSSSSYDCALESSSTSSLDHQQHYVTSYGEGSMGGGGGNTSESVGSLHVQASYSQQQNEGTRDDCCSVVTSCSSSEQVHNDESNQHNHSHHHNHHHNPTDCYLQGSNGSSSSGGGESLEKVYSGGIMGNDGNESGSSTTNSSIAGSPPHSNATSNTNNDLCSSTPSHMCDEGLDGTPTNGGGSNNNNTSSSLIPQSPEFGRDLSESDMVIVEKSFEADDDDDPPDPEDLMLDDDEEDCEEDDDEEERRDSKAAPSSDSNAISTTTNDLSRYCGNDEECDESNSNSSTGSNCSFSSALFGIKRANHTSSSNNNHGNSVSCNFNSDDNESCGSGGSLTFGSIGRSDSFSSTHHNHNSPGSSGSGGGGHCGSKFSSSSSPQKISKRSFSETDKDLVINTTTALSFGSIMGIDRKMGRVSHKNGCGSGNNNNPLLGVDGGVPVPKGWKREIFQANENHLTVYYVSPSDTKLRSWEELKNYICSDGTCKCGLSCPLRLESAFSFDPKVISVCIEKTEDQEDNHLRYSSSGEVEESHHNHQKQISKHQKESPSSPSLCNHNSPSTNASPTATTTTTATSTTTKRKIPKSEDSPLISSTRDDLGDCSTEKGAKKRRTSESESLQFCGGNPGNATPVSKESPGSTGGGGGSSSSSSSGSSGGVPSSSAIRSHVAVPCSQQSPDTTTQTPQTEMSPASSISSEPSSCGSNLLLGSSGGSSSSSSSSNRSLRSTPTPPSSSNGKVSTPPSSKRQQQGDFIWPPPPSTSTGTSTQMQLLSSPNTNNNNGAASSVCWTSPTTTSTSNLNSGVVTQSGNNATNQSQPKKVPSSSSGCHHLMPKPTVSGGPVKRVSSPCPNVDVRQIPLEQNQPPPKPPSTTSTPLPLPPLQPPAIVLASTNPTNLNEHNSNNQQQPQQQLQQQQPQQQLQQQQPQPSMRILQQQPIINQPQQQQFLLPTSSQAGLSCSIPTLHTSNVTTNLGGNFGLNSNANISFFPVTSTHNDMTNISMNLNSGFTISPIIQQTAGGMRILNQLNQPQISHQVLSSTNVPCSMPMQIQKVFTGIPDCTGGGGQTTYISGFQPNMVLSVLPQQQQPQLQEITPTIETKVEEKSSDKPAEGTTQPSSDSTAEKSPLQLVQDVVDRFESKTGGESEKDSSETKKESGGSTNSSKSVDGSADVKGTKDVAAVVAESDSKKAEGTKKSDGEGKEEVGEKKSSGVSGEHSTVPGETKVKVETDNSTKTSDGVSDDKDGCDEVTIISEGTISKTETVSTATSSVNTSTVTLAPMDQSTCVTTCVTNIGGPGGPLGTFTLQNQSLMNPGQGQQGQQPQIILQQQGTDGMGGAGQNFISTTGLGQQQSAMRYPFIQTIQPFFLNQAGNGGGPLIISPQQSHQTQGDPNAPQSFIYHQDPNHQQQIGQTTSNNPGDPTVAGGTAGQVGGIPQTTFQPQTTTMLFDPSTLCANNPNLLGALAAASGGAKKKKKRLSKKQQQQQAQLQLQQQLLLQQIQQQQAAAAFPLTIFPQSFNLGPQGFSLQPMNFFQTPTILTLPNLILNPADGTLFLQPSAPLSTTTSMPQQTMKFPLGTTTTTISPQPQQQQQMQQQPHQNLIAPKKDGNTIIQQQPGGGITILGTTPGQGQILEVGKPPSDAGSDDSRRNPTPDSSTGDVQLGILNAQGQPQGNTIISIAPHPTTTTQLIPANPSNKKISIKSRAVSSSSTVKRILPQKQILPKIDSTTPTIENN